MDFLMYSLRALFKESKKIQMLEIVNRENVTA